LDFESFSNDDERSKEDTGTLCRMCAEDEKRRRRDYERRRRERRGFVGPGERTDILW
jgi:hypothetical protein